MDVSEFMAELVARNVNQPEFHQAVHEVVEKVQPYLEKHPKYEKARIFERLVEPDRVIMFRVAWEDEEENVHVNRGYRVQFNNAIGPYKGGLRFDPSVNLSILKFLGFEQVLKNSLTTLPMGGAKGGSDFDPKGKTDAEVMRFCHAFMSELQRHIGKNVDIPAGDIGVGSREIGYLFGQYKRLRNEFTGAMTGKGVEFGGSPIRAEATGYGCVYFAEEMLGHRGDTMEGKVCLVSGAGNVAQYAAQKLIDLGARVVTLSDRGGTVHAPDGLTQDHVDAVIELKTVRRGSLDEFAAEHKLEFIESGKPWQIPGDLAFPCATQNEVQDVDAKDLIDNGCVAVSEGANMPVSLEASRMFEEGRVLHGAGKAANAGGVAISGLEMTQNSMRLTWDREEVDRRLQSIMQRIHEKCLQYGQVDGDDEYVDYVRGANIGGFRKVAEAMLAYGVM